MFKKKKYVYIINTITNDKNKKTEKQNIKKSYFKENKIYKRKCERFKKRNKKIYKFKN